VHDSGDNTEAGLGIAALRAALMVAAALAFFHAVPAADDDKRAHGRELVAAFQLPDDAVGRYAALARTASDNAAANERALQIDNAVWVGPLQQAGIGRNPYTIVLTVSGAARADGDVRARWQAGWEVRESATATREVLMGVGMQQQRPAQAGAPVTLTAASAPLSFRGERQVSPLLGLVHADNLDISDVQLQVWSGSAPLVAWPALSAPRPALLGLGALCLSMWFFLRGTVVRTPLPAKHSRLPSQTDLQPLLAHVPAAPTPTAPVPRPLAPPQNPSSRVVAALRDVLMRGLVVPTELDDSRRSRSAR
jgi:hypothetical protein